MQVTQPSLKLPERKDLRLAEPVESLALPESDFRAEETDAGIFSSKNRKEYISNNSKAAYALSSVFHLGVAVVMGLTGASDTVKKRCASVATFFTKLVNSVVYTDLAVDAYKNKNSFDFLSIILEPILNCFSQLSNYHLLRSLSSAMTQLHIINYPHVGERTSLWQNFIENLQVTKKFFVEAWTSSLAGPNRKLFKFSKDKGHTMALASHFQAATGIIGLLNGSRRNLIDKVVGTVRNLVGVIVDFELMFRKDKDEKLTGIYYMAHAILDTMKRFLPQEKADIIDNMIMPIYNAAMYHFGKITRNQSDDAEKKALNKTIPELLSLAA